jgi:hypothetical protein
MAFGQEFLQDFPPGQGLRDYTHASKTFKAGGYDLAPRTKFLFYVYFNLNTNIPAVANLVSGGKSNTIGLAVKSVQLPGYTIDVATMNQYNRKRLVQTKINYNPAQIVFNDDHSDLIRNMWYQYYQYYYSDPVYKYGNTPNQSGTLGDISSALSGFSYGSNDIYSASRPVQKWGLNGQGYANPTLQSLASSILTGPASGQLPFFNDITVYGMSQKTYAQYTMINPLITEWTHDTYDYSQGNGIMTHTMSIRYENVKYYSGAVGGAQPSDPVAGFADPAFYDTTRSPIASTFRHQASVESQGTIKASPNGSKQDLQVLVHRTEHFAKRYWCCRTRISASSIVFLKWRTGRIWCAGPCSGNRTGYCRRHWCARIYRPNSQWTRRHELSYPKRHRCSYQT